MTNDVSTVLTIRELAKFLRIGINNAYGLVRSGKVRCVRVGRQYRIPRDAVEDYLHQQKTERA